MNTVQLLNIPMPPSSNNMYRNFGFQGKTRRALSKEAVRWKQEMEVWAIVNRNQVQVATDLLKRTGRGTVVQCDVTFMFHVEHILTLMGMPKRNDTSNRLKPLHDALAGLLGLDDCWFFDGSFKKRKQVETEPESCLVELTLLAAPWMLPRTGKRVI